AGTAALFKLKVLSFLYQVFAGSFLARFLKCLSTLAVIPPVVTSSSMAGFTAHTGQHRFGRFNRIASFLTKSIHVTAYAVFVLGVVFGRIQLGFLFGFFLDVGFERFHRFGMRCIFPRLRLGFVAGTAFLAA